MFDPVSRLEQPLGRLVGLLAIAAVIAGSAVFTASTSAQTQGCPVPPENISPVEELDLLLVRGSDPTDSDQVTIDVTGRDGQVLTLSFTTDQQIQNADGSLESVTARVLVDGVEVFSNTRFTGDERAIILVSRLWTVPAGATHMTLQATLTLNNEPPETYTSGYLYFGVEDISLLTPEIPCPEMTPCDEALAAANEGATTFNGYRIVWAPEQGGSGSQVILGTDGPDHLSGGSGNDMLCGFGGDDVLMGGSGNDYLDGGAGFDVLYGGSGNDTLVNGEVNDGGSGRNTID